ncbi:hypothetical protein BIW11_00977 [Tropilaelaps mercedesae]|uniref:Cell cycle checkpoint protein RAD1-like n=1 Tax=Tropilaelaps mercedesae TaxID=418985 RepID=A0A1V9XLT9_9ACAR|nr:hypothetical protein BIW11_00977 [Tropilaelaps mercedesae]
MDDDEGYLLEALLEYPRILLNIIRSVRVRNKRAALEISSDGLRLISEEDRCIQAVAVVERQLFKQFAFRNDDNITFDISLDHLEQCLNLFGSTTSSYSTVKIVYPGRENSFVLFIDDGSIFSECELATFESDDGVEVGTLGEVVTRVMFNSDLLKETWAEMDQTASVLTLTVAGRKIALSTATMKIEIGERSDAVVLFESKADQDLKYNMKILRATQKALNLSYKSLLRIAENGTMAMQFLLKTEVGSDCCVEFFCKTLDILEDDSAML